jgi:hypothetical protein
MSNCLKLGNGGYLGKPIAIHRRRPSLASARVLGHIQYQRRFIRRRQPLTP